MVVSRSSVRPPSGDRPKKPKGLSVFFCIAAAQYTSGAFCFFYHIFSVTSACFHSFPLE
ncbi:hypothetical protein BDV93DRAFT_271 [Ceratobasidium sp. AG-I]|nr:hypothetical protein BDV93DRAFT_271 [Ceratobasidium sp. AG-I]